MRREYWAEISKNRILIYSSEYLAKQNRLLQLEDMRKNYWKYQKDVKLSDEKIKILKRNGVEVLMNPFKALKGCWHWFTGHSRGDAFRLTPEVERTVSEKGVYEIKMFVPEEEKIRGIDLSKFDPRATLFIVSCSRDKVWRHDPTAPDYIPAKYAYRGGFLGFLRWAEKEKIEKKGFSWVILSGKYGFIEPWHPISRYDEKFDGEGYYPISDDSLKNQVKQKRVWRIDGNQLREVRLEEFTNIIAVNCNERYYEKIKICFPHAEIQRIEMGMSNEEECSQNGKDDSGENNSDFHIYMQNLQNPNFLLKGCEIFFRKYEGYIDEVAESVWQDFLSGGKKPPKRLILGAVEAILIKWNCPFLYQGKAEELLDALRNDEISRELEAAYNSAESWLARLYDLSLGSPNFADHLETIKHVYAEFKEKPIIKSVGASKALHFIHPLLFVPWDTKIRNNYHKYDPTHNKQHEIGSPECYADFMKTCHRIATKVLEKISKEELSQRHPAYDKLRHIRTIAKMLDECNYCWFTKEERWDDRIF